MTMFFRRSGVKQESRSDCGPACLVFVARHFGRNASLAQLRQEAATDQEGTTVVGMFNAARSIGLSAKGIRAQVEHLHELPLPAILVTGEQNQPAHFVVLRRVGAKRLVIMDPAVGASEKVDRESFLKRWSGVALILGPSNEHGSLSPHHGSLVRFLGLLKPHRVLMAHALLSAAVGTLLALSSAIFVRIIVDHVVPDANNALLNLAGGCMIVAMAFKLGFSVTQFDATKKVSQRIDCTLMLGYYRHLLTLPQAFFDRMRVGDIVARFSDAAKIRTLVSETSLKLVVNIMVVVFSTGIVFIISWKLGLLTLLLFPVQGVVLYVGARLNGSLNRQITESTAELSSHITESLAGSGTVRRLRLESLMELRTEVLLVRMERLLMRGMTNTNWSTNLGDFFIRSLSIVFLWVGATIVIDAELSPGQLMSCYVLVGFMTGPIIALPGMVGTIQQALVATDRLFEMFNLASEPETGMVAAPTNQQVLVRVENIVFSYPDNPLVIRCGNLIFPPAKITVLTGPSGCGKSTLLALIQRLYLPASGRILLGDLQLSHFTLESLRRLTAVVPQKIDLFSGTLVDNITIGSQQPVNMARIVDLCRRLGMLEFIEALPKGFLTMIQEGGTNLSGGQRQRIAIARAIYRDAPILLMDEPSSALDAKSEKMFLDLLVAERVRGRTIIVSAHGTGIMGIADQVISFDQGVAQARPMLPMTTTRALTSGPAN